ncbi:MAG: DNA polymerase Y family protein [Dokdonella sp.]|uniref:Y-family DNA polymerase n=1 Tax=Dokdonella sp. TaxID=2291710 RepID=UPI003267F2D3
MGPAKVGPAPIAIIDGPLQRRHVVIANGAAAKAGVRAGQVLAAAQMLCPRLATTPRDEAAERQTLESLAAWAYRYSAEIHIAGPDTLFVEVGASLALFDGWAALERRLRHELVDLGFACSLAAAPTAAGARVLATHRDGITIPSPSQLPTALGIVPLTSSGLPQKTVAALQGMGFRTLADLFRLPRAELGRRIGEDSLDHLDRMRGLVGEALPRWHPPSRFERRIEFNFGIDTHTALAFPLQRLIRELALFLVTRDGGVQKFSLLLGHERGASTRVEVGLLAPQRDAASLFDLARARLERIELAAPVHALGLIADDLPPLCPLHQDLFENRRREELDWPALAERLRARLGDDALHGLASASDHRPDQAWRFVAATATTIVCRSGFSRVASVVKPVKKGKGIAAEAAPTEAARTMSPAATNESETSRPIPHSTTVTKSRPFWLLHRPIVLRESLARILAGPERIESGWWDERDQRRDYYIVETRRGQRAWAFVEAGKRDVVNETNRIDIDAAWMLHGWFA